MRMRRPAKCLSTEPSIWSMISNWSAPGAISAGPRVMMNAVPWQRISIAWGVA